MPEELEAELEFRVGSLDGELAFSQIWDMSIGPDGSLYVVEPREGRIRILSEKGEAIGQVGRRGAGPGEFSFPSRIGWIADTLWVLDGNNYRISLFDSKGDLAGIISPRIQARVSETDLPPRPSALLQDRRLFARSSTPSHLVAQGIVESIPYFLLQPNGSIDTEIFRLPATPPLWIHNPDSQNPFSGRFMSQPFVDRPRVEASSWDGTVVVADVVGDSVRINKIGLTGDTLWTRSIAVARRALSASVVDSLIQAEAESFSESPASEGGSIASIRSWIRDALVVPENIPVLTNLQVGSDGSIWVERVDAQGESGWVILDARGEFIGRINQLPDLDVLGVTRDRLAGVVRDEFDVPYVVSYTLKR